MNRFGSNTLYVRLRWSYRRFPRWLRRFVSRCRFLRAVKEAVKARIAARTPLDTIYDDVFFDNRRSGYREEAYRRMAQTIVELFRPQSIIDVGCGDGGLLRYLCLYNVVCQGIEGSDAGVKRCLEAGIPVIKMDLRWPNTNQIGRHFEMAICLEVAEHIPSDYAEELIKFLCQLAGRIIFSAAQPGQGGEGHLNEQPIEYWEAIFNKCGYRRNEMLTVRLREVWCKENVPSFYWKNVQFFERKSEHG